MHDRKGWARSAVLIVVAGVLCGSSCSDCTNSGWRVASEDCHSAVISGAHAAYVYDWRSDGKLKSLDVKTRIEPSPTTYYQHIEFAYADDGLLDSVRSDEYADSPAAPNVTTNTVYFSNGDGTYRRAVSVVSINGEEVQRRTAAYEYTNGNIVRVALSAGAEQLGSLSLEYDSDHNIGRTQYCSTSGTAFCRTTKYTYGASRPAPCVHSGLFWPEGLTLLHDGRLNSSLVQIDYTNTYSDGRPPETSSDSITYEYPGEYGSAPHDEVRKMTTPYVTCEFEYALWLGGIQVSD